MTEIPLTGYAPDLDPATPGVFTSVSGIEPTQKGWRLQRNLALNSSGATGLSYGAQGLLANGNTVPHLVGGASGQRPYTTNSISLVDVGRVAAYNASAGRFSFAQYGNYTLATNLLDPVQIRDATSYTNLFADSTATNIPKAKIAVTWGPPTSRRVMLLYYNNGTDNPTGWWSSSISGPTGDWTPNIATGAANGQLTGAGAINAGIAYRDDIIACTNEGMWLGRFDTQVIVDWQRIAPGVGWSSQALATNANGVLYFWGGDSLYTYDGSYPQKVKLPIREYLVANRGSISYIGYEAQGQRLLIDMTGTVSGVIVIHLPTSKIGFLSKASFSGVCDAGYFSASALYTQDTVPATSSSGTFKLLLSGSPEAVSLLRRVRPRFNTVPSSVSMAYVGGMSLDSTPTSGSASSSASPWNLDLMQANRYHWATFTLNGGPADPELIALEVDVTKAGLE